MSGKLGIAERYTRKTREPRVPPPAPAPATPPAAPSEEINPGGPEELTPKQKRLQSQIGTVIFSSFDAIGNSETPTPLKRKYCDKLRRMGVLESQLHPWCLSPQAIVTGNPDFDALEGGRSRGKQTLRRRRRRRSNKTDVRVRGYRKTSNNGRRTLSNGGRRTRKQ